jgi:hypothetical protein
VFSNHLTNLCTRLLRIISEILNQSCVLLVDVKITKLNDRIEWRALIIGLHETTKELKSFFLAEKVTKEFDIGEIEEELEDMCNSSFKQTGLLLNYTLLERGDRILKCHTNELLEESIELRNVEAFPEHWISDHELE